MKNSVAYTVKEIQEMLNISRSSAYFLVSDPPFPVLKIGKSIRVSKEVFDNWRMGR